MTRSTKTSAPVASPSIVLKTVHDAILKDSPNSVLTTKIMRVKLRATPAMRAIHVANASWIFTPAQADLCRAMFDASFAARLAKRAKAATRTPRAKKTSPVVEVATSDETA